MFITDITCARGFLLDLLRGAAVDQGDMEVRLGLPVSPFGDREKHGELAKGQTAFLTFVVEPLLRELEALEASISHLITRPVVRYPTNVDFRGPSCLASYILFGRPGVTREGRRETSSW